MTEMISEEKKQIVGNCISGIGEEFIAMQLDLGIPLVVSILKEFDIYDEDREEITLVNRNL
ncbi:MAG: hypothetical protein DLM72_09100 [Candidatus Nitrosopolaris wilkensis]|nr:MAG: hypothetical protein DLM72_09100 [Candidatus Nitrosopolaris wilkensis]